MLSHYHIDQLKRVEKEARGCRVITSEESLRQIILSYVEYYTGGKRDLRSFIQLIRYAMDEIVNGAYIEKDREALYDHLCELEYWTLTIHFNRFSSLPPWGLSSEYRIKQQDYGRVPMILVPLERYREVQYTQLLFRELKEKYAIHKKHQDRNRYPKVEDEEYFVFIREDIETGEFWGECPEIPGCIGGGRTVDELMTNMRQIAQESLKELGPEEIEPIQEIRRLVIK